MCKHKQGIPVEIQTPNTLEPDRLHHDRPAAYVIAQQYSPPPSFHCSFIPAMENSTRVSKMLFELALLFLKLRKLKLRTSGVYITYFTTIM
jgi:hypothetical protein